MTKKCKKDNCKEQNFQKRKNVFAFSSKVILLILCAYSKASHFFSFSKNIKTNIIDLNILGRSVKNLTTKTKN